MGKMQPTHSVTETVIGFTAGPAFGPERLQFKENVATRDGVCLRRLLLCLSLRFVLPSTASLSLSLSLCLMSEHSTAGSHHISFKEPYRTAASRSAGSFLQNSNSVHCRIHRSPQLVPIQSQINPIPCLFP
jgi:hypothetical protein